jgi:hypothetical protein
MRAATIGVAECATVAQATSVQVTNLATNTGGANACMAIVVPGWESTGQASPMPGS